MPFTESDAPIPLTAEKGDFDEVRGQLMVNLTASTLPNATIALDTFKGKAEDEVASRIAGAAEMIGNRRVRRAAIYLTAAYMCLSIRQIIRAEANDAMSYQVNQIDWAAKRDYLMGLADGEISDVLAEQEGERKPRPIQHFVLAKGRRGDW